MRTQAPPQARRSEDACFLAPPRQPRNRETRLGTRSTLQTDKEIGLVGPGQLKLYKLSIGYLHKEVSERSINPNPGYNFVALDLHQSHTGCGIMLGRRGRFSHLPLLFLIIGVNPFQVVLLV